MRRLFLIIVFMAFYTFARSQSDQHELETLPMMSEEGQEIDISDWAYRKKVSISQSGIQGLELDLETLSHAKPSLADLRLVKNHRQVPYILDMKGVSKNVSIPFQPMETKIKNQSRWDITLPYKNLPITHFAFQIGESVFEREVKITEVLQNARGDLETYILGSAVWKRGPYGLVEDLIIPISRSPESNHLILEINDQDNAPLAIKEIQGRYKSPKLLFKASSGDVVLYYGNSKVVSAQYDLNLLTENILTTVPQQAGLSPEEVLKSKKEWSIIPTGPFKYVFGGAMALIVFILLGVIYKLLPLQGKNSTEKENGE